MKTPIANLPATYHELQCFRANDIYLPEMNWEELVTDFFPGTVPQLAQGLSNTTSAFYGLMLKEIGGRYGNEIMESISKSTVYALGRRTTRRLLLRKPELERNAHGLAKVAMSAIFNASPEYSFEIARYDEDHVAMLMRGVDRYNKIARELGIHEWLSSPIDAFAQGINDELGLSYKVTMDVYDLDEESNCFYKLSFGL
ncbi:hypothetical protein [Taibaiella soli]|uniref:4-vinyl reductase 4VR domain-containing protein n=1 Tax=Taibaiella soli TaxID=1649169 RepID=A0A2W2BE68_9BACT|nr:hypothetical protein [Taibaiella soli]PZF71886.1 hypothetical protein DN068_17685 [Taibaiella soli]